MDEYADSSFLVSCYLADAHTPRARVHLSKLATGLPFTALHALEVHNALKLGVFRRLVTEAQSAAAWSDLESDLRAGRLVRTAMNWQVALRLASTLCKRHSTNLGTRSLDILHVACARSLGSSTLSTFDLRQAALARKIGMIAGP